MRNASADRISVEPWAPWASPWAHFSFYPPWRAWRLRGGRRLGPEYGPRTSSSYEASWERWNQSLAGGGLWDEREEIPRHGCSPRPLSAMPRPDADRMCTWLRLHADSLPTLELLVGLELYESGASLRQCALRLLNTKKHIVRAHQHLLRRYYRRREGAPGCMSRGRA